ncbi:MAG: hypothetical protein QXL15_01590 [Candidatus Korarchaeota archaeon]
MHQCVCTTYDYKSHRITFGVSAIELGLAQTLHMLFMAFSFVVMGYLSDKVSRKKLIFVVSIA